MFGVCDRLLHPEFTEYVISYPGWIHVDKGAPGTVYPKKYAHGFVVLCFVVVMQSFIMNSHEVFIHIHQGCFAGTGAIVRLPQCQWSKPDGYGKISQCITTTKHSKAKTVCIFLGIYCMVIIPESSLKFTILILSFCLPMWHITCQSDIWRVFGDKQWAKFRRQFVWTYSRWWIS